MEWSELLRKIIFVIVFSVIAFIIIKVTGFMDENSIETLDVSMQEDIDKERGNEFERTLEKVLIILIGWMREDMALAIVFGTFIASIIELIWPSGPLSELAQEAFVGLFEISLMGALYILPMIGLCIIGAVLWGILYIILFVPMLLVDVILCIVDRKLYKE